MIELYKCDGRKLIFVSFKALTKGCAAMTLLFVSLVAHGSDTLQVTDIDQLDLNSVSLNEEAGTAQFTVSESLTGVSTTYSLDLQAGVWSSWDSAGNAFNGQLPPNASTEWYVPCFSSPFAFGGCVAGAAIGAWFCGRRDSSFHARAASNCTNGIQGLNTGVCGFNASYSCFPDPGYGESNTP